MNYRKRVVIIYRFLPQYRKLFYQRLRGRLARSGIELSLVYGDGSADDRAKRDLVHIAWAIHVPNRIFSVLGMQFYWQPVLRHVRSADMVIVEQASKLLVNYVLFTQQALGRQRMAFWGHGRNFQVHRSSSLGEAVKRFVSRRAHWWFAYNDLSARIVRKLGYPACRITSVQNAIDTRGLIDARIRLTDEALEGIRQELGLHGNNVCIFAGGLYPDKRLGFLVEACDLVRSEVKDFELLVLGAGPEQSELERAARTRPWLHLVGPKFDEKKVPYFALSKLQLLPGLVGLAVLDSFALEVPLVTTGVPFHSPEIDYLVPDQNGLLVEDFEDVRAYAAAITRVLTDSTVRNRLIEGCRQARNTYTLEAMVENFATGIESALAAPPLRLGP